MGPASSGIVRLTSPSRGAGCACKLSINKLEGLVASLGARLPAASSDLPIGALEGDDDAVLRLDAEPALVLTADFLHTHRRRPARVGRIAAANALSDIYAMGGRPLIGRPSAFAALRQRGQVVRLPVPGGIATRPDRKLASTALSYADGLAKAHQLRREQHRSVRSRDARASRRESGPMSIDSTSVTNPYPECARLRTEPVVPADIGRMFGLEATDNTVANLPSIYAAMTFDVAHDVLRNERRFSSTVYAGITGPVMGRTILEMDQPEHHTYRSLLQQAFSRRAMQRWEAELVTPIVDQLIDAFADAGHAELVSQLTFPFPVNVIAGLLGLPKRDLPQFHLWAADLISVTEDFDRALAASSALRQYLVGFFAERRSSAGNDLISVLAHAHHEGQRLTDEEILAFCRLLLPAGAETTYRSSGNLLYGLLTHPDQLDALRKDRTLLAQAIEEGLRWECPLLTVIRLVLEDTRLCGVDLPAGAVLIVHLGSANHDERRWELPEAFDIFRPQLPHLAFAAGAHVCLGMHLARMETRVAVNRLLDRLPCLRLDPYAEAPAITGTALRAPTALPVLF